MARRLGISRMHVGRLARAGAIPNSRRTKGGHWFWLDTPGLKRWLNRMEFGRKFRKDRLSNAYMLGYKQQQPRGRTKPQREPAKQWPPDLEAILRLSRLVKFMDRIQGEKWTSGSKDRFVELLSQMKVPWGAIALREQVAGEVLKDRS